MSDTNKITDGMEISENGTCLVKYCGTDAAVTVPEGIRTIGVAAFEGSCAEQITLPETLEHIAVGAFFGSAVCRVSFKGRSLRRIGSFAFFQCTGLKEIDLPDSVVYIGAYAFEGTGIENITFSADRIRIAEGSLPENAVICALHIPVSDFYGSNRLMAAIGYFRMSLCGILMDENTEKSNREFVQENCRELLSSVLRRTDNAYIISLAARYMLENSLLEKRAAEALLERAELKPMTELIDSLKGYLEEKFPEKEREDGKKKYTPPEPERMKNVLQYYLGRDTFNSGSEMAEEIIKCSDRSPEKLDELVRYVLKRKKPDAAAVDALLRYADSIGCYAAKSALIGYRTRNFGTDSKLCDLEL